MKILPTDQFEEIRIRVSPGELVSFPVIDNKGLFVNHKGCGDKTGYLLESCYLDDSSYYGIYTCVHGMAILTAAFSSDEVISRQVALTILKSFPYLLAALKQNLRTIFPELKIGLHMDLIEPYYNKVYVSIENEFIQFSIIKDPRNLTQDELFTLSAIPGLAEKIVKIHG
ncbi:MAG: hypothetical protein E7B59_08065 [Enterobacteriaceae bacterium]|nr:hypothetical protein [Enterobacteriaceae bacterium]